MKNHAAHWARRACYLACGVAAPALADFTGITDASLFTVSRLGTLSAPLSTGTAAFSTTVLNLTGADTSQGCVGGVYADVTSPCQIQAVIQAHGLFSFNWAYLTADADGPPGDIFGVLVDGNRIALSDPGGAPGQLGSSSFSVNNSFGWFMNCTDCTGGTATVAVSNVKLVPEPATWALLLLAGVGLGLSRWQRA
jgi:hypothetical protein